MSDLTIRRTPATAKYYKEPLNGIGEALPLQMVLIPGGTFKMGSPEDEPDRRDNEGPLHEVNLSAFFMGRYPITQAHWRVVSAMPQEAIKLNPEPSHFKGDNRPNRPVEQVSWYEAVEFCDRLAKFTGRPYRLPSEAEWEYACRARTQTPFYFGASISDELANYGGDETSAVDRFGIGNAFGLSDMHGNVWEWCQDHWHNNYKGAPDDGRAWLTEAESAKRVIRGGAWDYDPRICRSAYRDDFNPDYRFNYIGFRVVCSAPRALQ
jgi:formylglycine-generating enzyme required for sulfatase activity